MSTSPLPKHVLDELLKDEVVEVGYELRGKHGDVRDATGRLVYKMKSGSRVLAGERVQAEQPRPALRLVGAREHAKARA